MEASTTLRYMHLFERLKNTCAESHTDQRVPGYIEGYVRRFWQVGALLPTTSHQ